jgi:hypothetical protein
MTFLRSGNAGESGRTSGIPERQARRWVAEYLVFATDRLELEARRSRLQSIDRDVEETEREKKAAERAEQALWRWFKIQCWQQCGRTASGGSGGEGEGCPSCPRRWIPK